MQMLHAGGIEPVTDSIRAPDEDNPRGYYEFERVKQLRTDKGWLDDAAGKAVKIIHLLLTELPDDRSYCVLFMRRDLGEVVRSQAKMLERNARAGAALTPERLMAIYRQQLATVEAWLAARPNFRVLDVEHRALIADPRAEATRIAAFLGMQLDLDAMTRAVDPALHRNKAT